MKKILLIVSSTLLLANSFVAQDDADKKYRFGLRVAPTPTWMRSNQTKLMEKSSSKFGFGFGLQVEMRINSTASFVTGIGGDFLGGKQTYKNGQGYVLDKDNNYVESKDAGFGKDATGLYNSTNNGNKFYEIKSRSIKTTYVTIPVLLKLMTKDISGFKYYGVFGANLAIQTKFRATDELTELKYNTTTNQYETNGSLTVSDMVPNGDLIPVDGSLNVGLGAEYNLSGTTSVFFSVNYIRAGANRYQKESEIMVDKIKDNINSGKVPTNSKQSAFSDGIQINVGILF